MIESPPPLPTRTPEPSIRIRNVSRWYGEVLGINKVTVDIYPGITGLVGPNGSGKSTLMNLICGLIWPGQGSITVLDQPVSSSPGWRQRVGYCTQIDHFYENFSGQEFVEALLALRGHGRAWARRAAADALERVNLTADRDRKIRAYSKGMRQRVKIALALAHQPEVLVLDEPFNGLDPVGRHEMMQLFSTYAREGRTILISSHILHEIDRLTNRILMMSNGYVMAEGEVHQVRDLLRNHPFQVFMRCREARRLAALLLAHDSVSQVSIEDEGTLSLATRDPDSFYLLLNDLIINEKIELDLVSLADENVQSIYDYLAGREHH
ncbi:MAG TPA: ABC transporter ATP-binding protein [Candidatus Sumerlaeota bacterium]|nr:ABC transporter ATP-binding protein [Candidatus Sumerlaeota bacterium]